MSIKKIALAALLSACSAPPAISQEIPDLVPHIAVIEGDVTSKGGIGIGKRGDIMFLPEGQSKAFPAELAVDRDTLKKITENCTSDQFVFIIPDLCSATISAEISLDGPMINLLIFDVQDLQPPKEES